MKIKKVLGNLDLSIAGAALVFLIILTFMNVVMRHVFNAPFQWIEEVQKWCFLWITYFGAGAVFRNGGHVAIDIIVDYLPAKVQKVITVLGLLITMYVLVNLFIQGSVLVEQLWRTKRTTSLLNVPYGILYISMPIGCVTMMASVLCVTFQKYKKNKEGGGTNER